MNLPTVERHYLTKDGDTVDNICWRYYGFTSIATEEVYSRNGFLSLENVILPGMLLIVLPVLLESRFTSTKNFWTSKPRKLYLPSSLADKAKLERAERSKGCCSDNPLEVEEADYLAVYIRNDHGDWVLRKIHKSKVTFPEEPYGTGTVTIDDPAFSF